MVNSAGVGDVGEGRGGYSEMSVFRSRTPCIASNLRLYNFVNNIKMFFMVQKIAIYRFVM